MNNDEKRKCNSEYSTWKKKVPRGKHHNETATKKTVSLYLSKKLVERARNHNLNLSKVMENALNNVLGYSETQNKLFSLSEGSLFGKRKSPVEPRAGFDPATNSLQGCRSTGLSHRGTLALTDFVK